MPQNYRFKDSISGKSYSMPWSRPAPPTDDELERFMNEQERVTTRPINTPSPNTINSVPPIPTKGAPRRFLEGLGEYASGIGKMMLPAYHPNNPVNEMVKAYTTPRDPNAESRSKLETIAEFAGIPVQRIREGDYAGAAGQIIPDLLLGGFVGKAGRLSRISTVKPRPRLKPITSFHKNVTDLNTVGLEELPANAPIGTIRLPPELRLMDALKKSEKASGRQAKLLSEDRARKLAQSKSAGSTTSGKGGFHQELGALKGAAPKIQMTPLDNLMTESDVDSLFDTVKNSPSLNPNTFESIRGRVALNKILGGEVPQSNEIELLSKVFGREFGNRLSRQRPLTSKAKGILTKVISTPKALRATMDFSFPLRQGLPYIGNKEFWKSFEPMFKSALSEKYFDVRQKAIHSSPLARQAKEAGLDLTDLFNNREESFIQSFAEEIPIIKRPIKASNRAYVAFGNDLRMQVFESMMKDSAKANGFVGKPEAGKIANFINVTTGRGGLGRLEKISGDLNQALFSPRLLSSRLQIVGNPALYLNSGKAVRKQALRSLISVGSFLSTAGLLAKSAGADISLDMESPDFLKIRKDNTVLDLAGGLQQPIRAMYRIVDSVRKGNYFDSKNLFEPSPKSISTQFLRNKLAPLASTGVSLATGKTAVGDDVTWGGELKNLFIPMITEDLYELYKEDPNLLPLGLPALFGGSIQVYPKRKSK